MIHKLFKSITSHFNKKDIKIDFACHNNYLQTLRFLLNDGIDERYNIASQLNFNLLSKDQCVYKLLSL